tara:strand:+ start:3916 stop:6078 length:2163 start_codon:yes stop_codon:yes gene_type:complete
MPSDIISSNNNLIDKKSNTLLSRLKSNKSKKIVKNALEFSIEMHKNQKRKSGDPYVVHCIDVANILVDWNMDVTTVASALLHDTVEDTDVTIEKIKESFGDDIAFLVDGVTKVDNIIFKSEEHKQAENFTKLFLSLAKDLRVIIIKFADRLNNMQTIEHLSPKKRKEIATETKEIFVPLAHRLGMASLKWHLEDLSLKCLDPKGYKDIDKKIFQSSKKSATVINDIIKPVKKELKKYKIKSDISGRYKSISSIYRKIQLQNRDFEDIYDLYAIRIIVDKIEDCYLALGVIHSMYTPMQDRFKDFIATPKTNGYQSIHTTVFTSDKRLTEIQIRTREMDDTAEIGIAAHWLYKGSEQMSDLDNQVPWLRDLLSIMSGEESEPERMMELLKIDMFEDEIFIFTPKGDLIKLPTGSTPLDFAFAIHSDIGFTCVRAKVNKKLVPLSYTLNNGDIVEVETDKKQKPNSGWLNFVKTSRASHVINKYLRNIEIEESIKIGNELLEKGLRKAKIYNQLDDIKSRIEEINYKNFNEFLSDLGRGRIMLKDVIAKFFPEIRAPKNKISSDIDFIKSARSESEGINLDGVRNLVVDYARCCNPIPGDKVVGYISRGRGLIIHRPSCNSLSSLSGAKDRLVPVNWDIKKDISFKTKLHITCLDKAGTLHEITETIAKENINILDVKTDVNSGGSADIWIVCTVRDLESLNSLIKSITKLKNVDAVERVFS